MLEILFWSFLFFIIYPYVIYPLIIFLLAKIRERTNRESDEIGDYTPDITLFVSAYNEEAYVDEKVKNSFELDYPKEKLKLVWVNDGSDDKTLSLLEKYDGINIYTTPQRGGKINAINYGMQFVETEFVILSDANTLLSKDAVKEVVALFKDKKIGCVAGEKRIISLDKDNAASSGESMYWKYESMLKKLDSEVGSCIGATGELIAIRRELYFKVPSDTILDDFIMSLTIAMRGYRIGYAPKAYAVETASANIEEEMKRKVRIAAGNIQSLVRLKPLLNILKYKFLSFQYISHKVMRWVFAPISIFAIVPVNILLATKNSFYWNFLFLQVIFYVFVLLGSVLKDKKIKLGFIFVPYYFFMANISMWYGFFRYIKGNQSVKWERAKRA